MQEDGSHGSGKQGCITYYWHLHVSKALLYACKAFVKTCHALNSACQDHRLIASEKSFTEHSVGQLCSIMALNRAHTEESTQSYGLLKISKLSLWLVRRLCDKKAAVRFPDVCGVISSQTTRREWCSMEHMSGFVSDLHCICS
jgi:hypothetical protein